MERFKTAWLVPVKNKVPISYKNLPFEKWKQYNFNEYFNLLDEIKELKENGYKLACWGLKSNILCIDIDEKEIGKQFNELIKQSNQLTAVLNNTLIEKTNKGIHIYFDVSDPEVFAFVFQKLNNKKFFDGKIEFLFDHLFIVYSLTDEERILNNKEPYKLSVSELTELYNLLKKYETREEKEIKKDIEDLDLETEEEIKTKKEITEETIFEILEKWLNKYYIKSNRHNFILGIAGAFARFGIKKQIVLNLVKLICEKYNDEEEKDRIRAVEDTYLKYEKIKKGEIKENVSAITHFLKFMNENEALKFYNYLKQKIRELNIILTLKDFKNSEFYIDAERQKLIIVLPFGDKIIANFDIKIDKENYKIMLNQKQLIKAMTSNLYIPSRKLVKFLMNAKGFTYIIKKAKRIKENNAFEELLIKILETGILREEVTLDNVKRFPIVDLNQLCVYCSGQVLREVLQICGLSSRSFKEIFNTKQTVLTIEEKRVKVHKILLKDFGEEAQLIISKFEKRKEMIEKEKEILEKMEEVKENESND